MTAGLRMRRLSLIVPAVLLMVLAVLLTNVFPFRQIIAQERQLDLARRQLVALEEENALLETRSQALQTDVEVERIARESLGYVRPGETAYVVATIPEVEAVVTPATPPREVAFAEPQGFLDRVWAFLTGRDLMEPSGG
jgi:cell division protein FtsB